jgi:hypothetical protein
MSLLKELKILEAPRAINIALLAELRTCAFASSGRVSKAVQIFNECTQMIEAVFVRVQGRHECCLMCNHRAAFPGCV